jgi:hypothetical protein
LQQAYITLQSVLTKARLEAEPIEEDVPDFPPQKAEIPSSNAAAAEKSPTIEALTEAKLDPSGPASSSAIADETRGSEAEAEAQLKSEALGWEMPEKDIDDLIKRYSLDTARNLLWQGAQARRKATRQAALA